MINSPPYGFCGASHVHTDPQDDPYRMPTKDYAVHRQLRCPLTARVGVVPLPSDAQELNYPQPTIYYSLSTVCCLLSLETEGFRYSRIAKQNCQIARVGVVPPPFDAQQFNYRLPTICYLLSTVCCLLDYDFRRALFARMRALLCSLRVFEKMWLPSPLATK